MAETTNALQDNIQRKGNNAYYYAHANSSETVKNYGGTPQQVTTSHELPTSHLKVKIKTYSWADGKKSVKVYVPLNFICDYQLLDPECIKIDWTPTSLRMTLENINSKNFELSFLKLHDDIKDVSHRVKEDSVVVTLHKVTELSWNRLVSK